MVILQIDKIKKGNENKRKIFADIDFQYPSFISQRLSLLCLIPFILCVILAFINLLFLSQEHGFRRDIFEKLQDLKPRFVRFPGKLELMRLYSWQFPTWARLTSIWIMYKSFRGLLSGNNNS